MILVEIERLWMEEIAKESAQTIRAREKLAKAWQAEKQVTPEALKETVDKIHQWIADNAQHRVPVEGKGMQLFNGNRGPSEIRKGAADC